MISTPPRSAAARYYTWGLTAAYVLDFGTAVTYVALSIGGDPIPPGPLNLMIMLTFAAGTVALLLLRRFEAMHRSLEHRLDTIHDGLVGRGVAVEQVTGEIPRPTLVPAVSPDVLSLTRRLNRQLARNED